MIGRNIIFISKFSPENVELAKFLCSQNTLSSCLFWENGMMKESKNDFNSVMGTWDINNAHVLQYPPEHPNFYNEIVNFIHSRPFEADLVLLKGSVTEATSIYMAKENLMSTTCGVILENIDLPLEPIEKECLESMDIIFSMGPSNFLPKFSHKTVRIFKHFDAYKFEHIPSYFMSLPNLNQKLICCNSSNFEELKEIALEKNINLLDIDTASDEDIFIHMTLCKNVVDMTDIEEFEYIIYKFGNKVTDIEDNEAFDYIEAKEHTDFGLKELSKFIGNKILGNANIKKGNSLEAIEIK